MNNLSDVQDGASVSPSPVIAIIGPTAVGKTGLSIYLAERLNGEIVSADSRLFYRGMDIGTAKPTPQERARVPHHLIDIAEPNETIGLAQFLQLAHSAIADIHARGRLPFVVGGTGQYVRALLEGWSPPAVPPDPALRAQLEEEARREGPQVLYARLAALDPQAAAKIDPRNVRRVIRALEVCLRTGRPFSAQRTSASLPYRVLQVGLTMDRKALYARADERVEAMMRAGLMEEVRRLLEAGYTWDLPAMSGLGYIQFRPYFEGRATLEEVVAQIKRDTRRLIRHQYAWFRLSDPRIHWFDVGHTGSKEILAFVEAWLKETATRKHP
ncbi:MAG: tRNA (adenosine(37)-N6)-dimethylallyltransferase MiaA [Anaerolineae bacterium]|nr:tRNA (adenosine(37)-N6)-dimethylallyltransferase MiaA [Anaerolineae bacterium]MCX8068005.1 tRNA (adenosine(37)-N6)-dimethylallyltransferase MiaA [Anaerolineae bacterium]MDW7992948.1 tRNA (adenosine(37)-N6)-dimethylallyltransferase MiaA [Anaerolineae bacterium]